MKRTGHSPFQALADMCHIMRLRLDKGLQLGPVKAFHQHPHIIAGEPENLADFCHNAHGVKLVFPRFVVLDIPLRDQKNQLIAAHGFIQGLNRFLPSHIEMQDHFRKNDQTTERQQRHSGGPRRPFLNFHTIIPNCLSKQTKGQTANAELAFDI